MELRGSEKLQVGFTLTLYAAVPMKVSPGAERQQAAVKLREELSALAEAAVPETEGRARAPARAAAHSPAAAGKRVQA